MRCSPPPSFHTLTTVLKRFWFCAFDSYYIVEGFHVLLYWWEFVFTPDFGLFDRPSDQGKLGKGSSRYFLIELCPLSIMSYSNLFHLYRRNPVSPFRHSLLESMSLQWAALFSVFGPLCDAFACLRPLGTR